MFYLTIMTKKNFNATSEGVDYEQLKQYAEENKLFMTDAERALWNFLRTNTYIGEKFKRQQIIGDYIADFASSNHKLVVEVEGKYHFKGDQPVSEEQRTADLNRMGYTVICFSEGEVMTNIHKVGYQIKGVIQKMKVSFASQNPQTQSTSAASPSGVASKPAGTAMRSFPMEVKRNAWAVDAACSGNPGPMEYRCIDLSTGTQVFHFGPVHGTNNIGEFLAIVHALALMQQKGITDKVIYSDSVNAAIWVNNKKCKTKLERNAQTEELYQIIARGEHWLQTHNVTTPILKWETKKWGEIPADFGRK